MWKRNPLIHAVIAFSLALCCAIGLFTFIVLKADFWEDGRKQPINFEGVIESRSPSQFRNGLTRINVTSKSTVYAIEVNYRLYNQLLPGKSVQVTLAPNFSHTYAIKLLPNGPSFSESEFNPDTAFQEFQLPILALLGLVGLLVIALTSYSLIGLLDWLLPLRRERGRVVARLEQGESSNTSHAILIRRWSARKNERNLRFYLSEKAFEATEGVQFAAISFTPIFRYVRQMQAIAKNSLSPTELAIAESLPLQAIRLCYLSDWRKRWLLLSDGYGAIMMFISVVVILAIIIPHWTSPLSEASLPERYYLPALAFCFLMLAFYLSSTFLRKLKDLRAPKTITVGPVLSKWRVNGGTNEARRQIVVVDGGLQAGSEGVRKFDISTFLFEELKVGDIVEIEHTPRLRYIFRLEVKGYQELSPSLSQ